MAGTNFLYYCSVQDVKDEIFDIHFVADDANTPFDDRRIRRAISRAYSEINGALKAGGYDVPVSNSVKTLTTAGETAETTNPTVIAVTAGDGESFTAGDTVRIHGVATTPYNDEFTGVVLVSSDDLTVEYLENSYDAGATVELCTEGYLFLRSVNAICAAARLLLGKVVGQAKSRNDKITTLMEACQENLRMFRDGEIVLDGLTTGGSVVSTYISDNPNANDVVDRTVTMNMEF